MAMIHQYYTPEVHLGKINSHKQLASAQASFQRPFRVPDKFFLKRLKL